MATQTGPLAIQSAFIQREKIMTMNAQQVNVQSVLAQLISEVESFANDGILKPALEGLVDAYPNGVIAAAMSATFEGVNISPRSASTTSKAKLKQRLSAQLDAILDAKTAPTVKASGFSLDSYRASPSHGVSNFASPVVRAPALSPMEAKIAELEAKLASATRQKAVKAVKVVQPDAVTVKITKMTPRMSPKYGPTFNFKVKVGSKATSYKVTSDGVLTTYDKKTEITHELVASEVLTSDVRRAFVLAWGSALAPFSDAVKWI